jgi:hypothetical protein
MRPAFLNFPLSVTSGRVAVVVLSLKVMPSSVPAANAKDQSRFARADRHTFYPVERSFFIA